MRQKLFPGPLRAQPVRVLHWIRHTGTAKYQDIGDVFLKSFCGARRGLSKLRTLFDIVPTCSSTVCAIVYDLPHFMFRFMFGLFCVHDSALTPANCRPFHCFVLVMLVNNTRAHAHMQVLTFLWVLFTRTSAKQTQKCSRFQRCQLSTVLTLLPGCKGCKGLRGLQAVPNPHHPPNLP